MTMKLFTLLKDDHETVKRGFKDLMSEEEINVQDLEVICNQLTLHMQLEEKFLYPVMQEQESARELTEEAILEHKEAERIMKEIQGGKLDPMELKVKAEMLQLAIEHHVEEEESTFFEEVRNCLSEDQIDEISQQMVAFKQQAEKKSVRK
jgi:iron-sulfur cluster repair protein YtfE (RIC family)